MSDELGPEEIEELKRSISEKIEIIRQNAEDEITLKKMKEYSASLREADSKFGSDAEKAEHYKKLDKRLNVFEHISSILQEGIEIDPSRVMALTDGVFSIVMTLLIFGISLPNVKIVTNSDFVSFISTLAPTVGVTVVSFILIASFWIYHHKFIKINTLNLPYLWLNVALLICISFIPFTTSLIGHYSHFALSEVLFGFNICLTAVVFLLLYRYARLRNFLEKTPTKKEKNHVLQIFLMLIGLTITVNSLDVLVSNNFIYLFFLVPLISTFMDTKFKLNNRNI